MGVDNGCANPLSTGASREAPVDNGFAHPLSTPIVHRCFARSTCGQWVCTPIVHTHCPRVLRVKHLWTMGVHTHSLHLLSTVDSREAPVDNGCARFGTENQFSEPHPTPPPPTPCILSIELLLSSKIATRRPNLPTYLFQNCPLSLPPSYLFCI